MIQEEKLAALAAIAEHDDLLAMSHVENQKLVPQVPVVRDSRSIIANIDQENKLPEQYYINELPLDLQCVLIMRVGLCPTYRPCFVKYSASVKKAYSEKCETCRHLGPSHSIPLMHQKQKANYLRLELCRVPRIINSKLLEQVDQSILDRG